MKKLADQRSQLLCEENSRRMLLLKKLSMIRQNIVKAQEQASSQAKLLHKQNQQRIGFKTQIKTQKMYFDLFNQRQDPAKSGLKGTQNLTLFVRKHFSSNLFQSNFQRNFQSIKSQSGVSKKDTLVFIKSHVNSSCLVPFSVSYEGSRRQQLDFLAFLKSLPFVCHFFLSRIQAREVPVNVLNRKTNKLHDLRKVHEILHSLEGKKQGFTNWDLCQMYDHNLNLKE